jgi:hypothetical protein
MSSLHRRGVRRELLICALIASVACKESEHPPQGTEFTSSTSASASPAVSAQSKSGDCGDRTIRGERVGKIAIGDPVESLTKCHVVRDTVVQAGEGTTARKVFIALAADTVAAEIVDGRVWRIEVSSPAVRTVDSLGVGTPLRRLLQMSNPRGASGEGRMFVLSPDHCGQSFEISYFGPMPSGGWTRAALAKLPETTHVIGVLVVRCHPELY